VRSRGFRPGLLRWGCRPPLPSPVSYAGAGLPAGTGWGGTGGRGPRPGTGRRGAGRARPAEDSPPRISARVAALWHRPPPAPDTITLDLVRSVVDQIVTVDELLLRRALAGVVTNEHLIVEGAAAAGPAAMLSGEITLKGNVAVILTGANIDADRFCSVLRAS